MSYDEDFRCGACDSRYCVNGRCEQTETSVYLVGKGHLEPEAAVAAVRERALWSAAWHLLANGEIGARVKAAKVWSIEDWQTKAPIVVVEERWTADHQVLGRGNYTTIIRFTMDEVMEKAQEIEARQAARA